MEGEEPESLVSTAQSNMVNLEGRCSVSGKPPASCSLARTAWAGASWLGEPRVPVPPFPKPYWGRLWRLQGRKRSHTLLVWLLQAKPLNLPPRCLREPLRAERGSPFSGSACFQIGGVFVPCARLALHRLICLMQKNAVIESLQEQVSSAKEKLMRLMSAESGCDPHVPPLAPCTWSTGQRADTPGDCHPPDPEWDGWQPPSLLGIPPPLCSHAQDLQKHASHKPVCSRMLLFDTGDNLERGLKDTQEHGRPAGQGQPPEQLPGQDISGGVAWELSPKVSYVSSEKLREVLQELSLDGKTYSPTLPGGPPPGSQHPPGEQEGTWGAQEGYPGIHTPFSPYLARRRRRIPLSPVSTRFPGHASPRAGRGVEEAGGWGCGESAHVSLGREGEMAGDGLLHPPAPSPPAIPGEVCLQPEGWPESRGASPRISREQRRQQGTPRGPAEPSLRSLYYYPDSDSSSSSSEEMFHGCHRPCCKVCFQSPRGSLGSSSTDTDTEPSGLAGHWTEHHSSFQPVVNFKEDLKPTFV